MEIRLTFLGYNIRKYFSYFSGKQIKKYWTAPSEDKAEKFKEPRFNILQKNTLKKKWNQTKKQKNTITNQNKRVSF